MTAQSRSPSHGKRQEGGDGDDGGGGGGGGGEPQGKRRIREKRIRLRRNGSVHLSFRPHPTSPHRRPFLPFSPTLAGASTLIHLLLCVCSCGLSGLFTTRASKRTSPGGGREGVEIRYNSGQCKLADSRYVFLTYTELSRSSCVAQLLRADNGTVENGLSPSRSPRAS